MRKSFPFWQVVGFGFTSVVGTLLHFLLDWSNGNVVVALFSAVNESIWEHMKLLYFPLLVYAWVEYTIIGKGYDNFWCVKLVGTIVGLVLVPTLYYTYSGVIGRSVDLINIAIFYIAAAVTFRLENKLLTHNRCKGLSSAISLIWLLLIGIVFIFLTFSPPRLPLFQDPISGNYGYLRFAT